MYDSTAYFLNDGPADVAPAMPKDVLHFSADPEMPSYSISENSAERPEPAEITLAFSGEQDESAMHIRLTADDPVIPEAELEKPNVYDDDLPLPSGIMPKEFTHMPRLH